MDNEGFTVLAVLARCRRRGDAGAQDPADRIRARAAQRKPRAFSYKGKIRLEALQVARYFIDFKKFVEARSPTTRWPTRSLRVLRPSAARLKILAASNDQCRVYVTRLGAPAREEPDDGARQSIATAISVRART